MNEIKARHLYWLGMSLKLSGLKTQGRRRLKQAFQLRPCYKTWRALGDAAFDPVHPAVAGGRHLALDVSDLLQFLVAHGLVTGIQRVQLELLKSLLGKRPNGGFDRVQFCFSAQGHTWALEEEHLQTLIAYAESGRVHIGEAKRLVKRAWASGRPYRPPPGSAYLVLGAFWAGKTDAHRHRVRAGGGAFGVLVHDLFPINLPELCEAGATAVFETRFRAGLETWDFIVANSRFTANSVRDYITQDQVRPDLPVIAAPLAHSQTRSPCHDGADAGLPKALRGRRFVLCVGTIEPRKNITGLIEAWKGLDWSACPPAELVLVGRPGWRMDSVVKALRNGALRRYAIRWLEGVSDAGLESLYRNCLFTVYPSLAEGWGLPIGESLVHGKVCLTSNTTAMPEVGGDFAVYMDPGQPDSLRCALQTLLTDDRERALREARIRHDFQPRSWSDFAADLVSGLAAL
jgi:glycosyltransferase involved in cell wall biosynthesis